MSRGVLVNSNGRKVNLLHLLRVPGVIEKSDLLDRFKSSWKWIEKKSIY